MRISDWSSDVCSSDLSRPKFAPQDRLLTPESTSAFQGSPRALQRLLCRRSRLGAAIVPCWWRPLARSVATRSALLSGREAPCKTREQKEKKSLSERMFAPIFSNKGKGDS